MSSYASNLIKFYRYRKSFVNLPKILYHKAQKDIILPKIRRRYFDISASLFCLSKQNLPAFKKQGVCISYFRSQPSDELPASMEMAAWSWVSLSFSSVLRFSLSESARMISVSGVRPFPSKLSLI